MPEASPYEPGRGGSKEIPSRKAFPVSVAPTAPQLSQPAPPTTSGGWCLPCPAMNPHEAWLPSHYPSPCQLRRCWLGPGQVWVVLAVALLSFQLILVSSTAIAEHQTGTLTQAFISHSRGLSLRSRHQQIQCLVRTRFLVHKWPTSPCVLPKVESVREMPGVSL